MTDPATAAAAGAPPSGGASARARGRRPTHGAAAPATQREANELLGESVTALDRAAVLTSLLAELEDRVSAVRAERLGVLRQATRGLPVSLVAQRLGMSRQRVYNLVRNES